MLLDNNTFSFCRAFRTISVPPQVLSGSGLEKSYCRENTYLDTLFPDHRRHPDEESHHQTPVLPFICGLCGTFQAWSHKQLLEHSRSVHPLQGISVKPARCRDSTKKNFNPYVRLDKLCLNKVEASGKVSISGGECVTECEVSDRQTGCRQGVN